MNDTNIPIWLDANRWDVMVKYFPQVSKKVEELTARIEVCKNEENRRWLTNARDCLVELLIENVDNPR
jgi:hypothetical protein